MFSKTESVIGVWKSDSRGEVLHFYTGSDNQLMLARFQFTAIGILPEQEPFAIKNDDLNAMQISKDALAIERHVYIKKDPSCISNILTDADPLTSFSVFAQTFSDFYAFFDARKVDWQKTINYFRDRVSKDTMDEDLFKIFQEMIEPLKDNHVALAKGLDEDSEKYLPFHLESSFKEKITSDMQLLNNSITDMSEYVDTLSEKVTSLILDKYVDGKLEEKIIFGTLKTTSESGGCIGYLNILSMEHENPSTLERQLDKMIDFFNENKISALVLDVRFNQGGSDEIALTIAKRFASQSKLMLTKQEYYQGGTLTPPIPLSLEVNVLDNTKRIWDPNIQTVLLTSPITASAAETFVLAVSTFDHVTRVGGATMGILSDQFARKLPNGWWVMLSNERRLDPNSQSYEAIGIPVNHEAEFPLMQHIVSKNDPGIEASMQILNVSLPKNQSRMRL